MEEITIVNDKDLIDFKILSLADPLPQIIGYFNQCSAFVAMLGDVNVGASLCSIKQDLCDIINLSIGLPYQGKGYDRQLVMATIDFAKENGVQFVEIGSGNAFLDRFAMLQKIGFRIISVKPNHYLTEGRQSVVENGIYNRDMLRFRLDLATL